MPMNTQHGYFAAALAPEYELVLATLKSNLDWLINATPSGEARNQFTNANIHIGLAERILEDRKLQEKKD